MLKPDPKHQQSCAAFVRLEPSEVKRRMSITDYRDPQYIASEILAAMARARFGRDNGVLDVVGRTLFERTVRLMDAYLRKNRRWQRVANMSSETRRELSQYIWVKLLSDKADVCYAEVRFVGFVEARIADYLRTRLNLKEQAKSLDVPKADGQRPWIDGIEDESTPSPEEAATNAQVSAALETALLELAPLERKTIILHVLKDHNWATTAASLGCSVTTAKEHMKRGLEKLRGVQV
jgi:RNA polymerase sigma factor (sigma-70 family)